MKEKPADDQRATPKSLRERAEALLSAGGAEVADMDSEAVQRLVHELQVHQIELEIQNEELREAQVALSETRDRYADLYEFAPVGYITLEKEGGILEANLAAAALLGTDRKELVGRNLSEFVEYDSQDRLFLHRREVLSGDGKQTCELEIKRGDGGERIVSLESIAIEDGEEPRIRTALIDITARKRAEDELRVLNGTLEERIRDGVARLAKREQQLRLAQKSARMGVWEWDMTNRRLNWDDVMFDLFGAMQDGELTLETFFGLAHPDDMEELKKQFEETLEGKDFDAEFRIVKPGGEVRWIASKGDVVRDDENRPLRFTGVSFDITERRERDENLRCEHELSEGVISTARAIILVLDRDGKILRYNPYMEALSGWKLEEVQGRDWFDTFLPEQDRNRVRARFYRAEGGEQTTGNVNSIVIRNGEEREIIWFDSPLTGSRGELTGLLCLGHDITERNRVEKALHRSKEGFRTVLETIADGIISIDREGIITQANAAAERMFGYEEDELTGQNIGILMPSPAPGKHDGYMRRYRENGETHIIGVGREVQAKRKDGTIFPADLSVSEVDHLGVYTGIVRDISERKKVEEDLRCQTVELKRHQRTLQAILDSAQGGVVAVDADGGIVMFNSAAQRILGVAIVDLPPEEWVGHYGLYLPDGETLYPMEDLPLMRVMEGKEVSNVEMFIRNQGRPEGIWINMSGYPIMGENGERVGCVTTFSDVTARKRYELDLESLVEERTRELKNTQAELLRSERLAVLGQLAGGVAHELRTPLGVISNAVSYLAVASGKYPDPEFPTLLGEMNRAVSKSDHIISEMLDFVREPSCQSSAFPVGPLIPQVLETVTVPENVDVEISGEEQDTRVAGNEDQVARILGNLMMNAIQAMPEGGDLVIGIEGRAEEVCVSVRDTGSGIPKNNLERIFEPLFSTKTTGIGLGLAVCRRYAEMHGGRLEVESEEGSGAEFRLYLKKGASSEEEE